MKNKILSAVAVFVLTTAAMLTIGTTGLAFGECGSPQPVCQPAVRAIAHNPELTKFLNYFGLTWMQAPPPIQPVCHPPCDGITQPLATPSNTKTSTTVAVPKK